MRWLGVLLLSLGWPVQASAQVSDTLAAVRAALLETKRDIEGLRMPVYIAQEKWVPDSTGRQRGAWTRSEIDSVTVSWLPVLTRAESELLACDAENRCRSLVAAVVIRVAEPVFASTTEARVRLIWHYPVSGDLNRLKWAKALISLQRREGAWVVVEAEYTTP